MKTSTLFLTLFCILILSLNIYAHANMEKTGEQKAEESSLDKSSDKELKVWSKYDFVPSDKIIFEDNLAGEQNGEFPSKWDLIKGNAENAVLGDENVISFAQNQTEIAPLMKTKDFLPDIFTIEFDVYFYNKYNEAYMLNLRNLKRITIRNKKVSMGDRPTTPSG